MLERLKSNREDLPHRREEAAEEGPVEEEAQGPRPASSVSASVLDKVIELAETERKCSVCDGELSEMTGQFEESEVATVVKRSFVFGDSPHIYGRTSARRSARPEVESRVPDAGSGDLSKVVDDVG